MVLVLMPVSTSHKMCMVLKDDYLAEIMFNANSDGIRTSNAWNDNMQIRHDQNSKVSCLAITMTKLEC